MKINFSTQLLDVFGKPMMANGPEDGTPAPLTLGSASIQALLATFPDEQHLSGVKKAERFVLASKLAGATDAPLDITLEQTAELKSVIGKAWGPAVVGRAYELLDPA